MSQRPSLVIAPTSPRAAANGNGHGHGASKAGSGLSSHANESKCARLFRVYDLGNVALLISLICVLIGVEQVHPHHRRIVNRDDPSINYPLLDQQVPMWLLVILVGAVPVVIIIGIYIAQRKRAHAKRELYYVLFGWCYSMIITVLLTDFIKRVVGRPRPNFVELSGYQGDDKPFTGTSKEVEDAFQSFVSGHTSSAFAGLGYLSFYIFRLCFPVSFKSRELAQAFHVNQGWKTVIALAPICLAIWIGLTRIIDYWHNCDDVAIGAVLGFSIAALTFEFHVNWWWHALHMSASKDDDATSDPDSTRSHYGQLPSPPADSTLLQSPTADSGLLDEKV